MCIDWMHSTRKYITIFNLKEEMAAAAVAGGGDGDPPPRQRLTIAFIGAKGVGKSSIIKVSLPFIYTEYKRDCVCTAADDVVGKGKKNEKFWNGAKSKKEISPSQSERKRKLIIKVGRGWRDVNLAKKL